MANLIRSVKPGSDWTRNELIAYNISIIEQDQDAFFGGPLPLYAGPAGSVQHEERVHALDAASLALIKRLNLAMELFEGEESAVTDFAAEILRALGYETKQTVVRTRKTIRLFMCGETVYANTDVCLIDADSEILLFVQVDKTRISASDPEPQLVAGAVAAFQSNNAIRMNELFLQTCGGTFSQA